MTLAFSRSALVLATCLIGCAAFAQPRNHATLAMGAEPQTLDPMASTADLVGTIMQHVYEPLYTFDVKWNVAPMLAESLPKISADGKTYTIALHGDGGGEALDAARFAAAGVDLGVDDAGAQCIDGDAFAGHFARQAHAEGVDGGLAGGVVDVGAR